MKAISMGYWRCSEMRLPCVQPALAFLRETIFRGAREEFLTTHKRYRQGQEKACIAAPAWPVVPKPILTIGNEAPGRLH